ncbi:hypothetical protein NOR_04244 [Metarhizium rileyi]|uniref:Uncharacterized protein n=1 Tax=Metarhizium rileyi (strain RCEF 4871) TaxID=1649241 RepID=A0A167EC81_METRR|nr:hypothetical protein NOR_04244 [Metarhizium rileyi RCEF 4871]
MKLEQTALLGASLFTYSLYAETGSTLSNHPRYPRQIPVPNNTDATPVAQPPSDPAASIPLPTANSSPPSLTTLETRKGHSQAPSPASFPSPPTNLPSGKHIFPNNGTNTSNVTVAETHTRSNSTSHHDAQSQSTVLTECPIYKEDCRNDAAMQSDGCCSAGLLNNDESGHIPCTPLLPSQAMTIYSTIYTETTTFYGNSTDYTPPSPPTHYPVYCTDYGENRLGDDPILPNDNGNARGSGATHDLPFAPFVRPTSIVRITERYPAVVFASDPPPNYGRVGPNPLPKPVAHKTASPDDGQDDWNDWDGQPDVNGQTNHDGQTTGNVRAGGNSQKHHDQTNHYGLTNVNVQAGGNSQNHHDQTNHDGQRSGNVQAGGNSQKDHESQTSGNGQTGGNGQTYQDDQTSENVQTRGSVQDGQTGGKDNGGGNGKDSLQQPPPLKILAMPDEVIIGSETISSLKPGQTINTKIDGMEVAILPEAIIADGTKITKPPPTPTAFGAASPTRGRVGGLDVSMSGSQLAIDGVTMTLSGYDTTTTIRGQEVHIDAGQIVVGTDVLKFDPIKASPANNVIIMGGAIVKAVGKSEVVLGGSTITYGPSIPATTTVVGGETVTGLSGSTEVQGGTTVVISPSGVFVNGQRMGGPRAMDNHIDYTVVGGATVLTTSCSLAIINDKTFTVGPGSPHINTVIAGQSFALGPEGIVMSAETIPYPMAPCVATVISRKRTRLDTLPVETNPAETDDDSMALSRRPNLLGAGAALSLAIGVLLFA